MKPVHKTAAEISQLLLDAVWDDHCDAQDDESAAAQVKDFTTFAEAGMWSSDAGFVLRMQDGSEFQITVVRSK